MPLITPNQTKGPTPNPAPVGGISTTPVPPSADTAESNTARNSDTAGSQRRRWPWALGGAAIIAGGLGAATLLREGGDETSTALASPVNAVEATSGDLAEFLELDGIVSVGEPLIHGSTLDGVITRSAAPGTELTRGDTAYAVNEQPVVVLWGDVPLYRAITGGIEDGADIAVLEANLAVLGHDAEGALVVDETADAATTAAINELQADTGQTVDGTLDPADVIMLAGPTLIDDVIARVGSTIRIGNPVLALQPLSSATTITAATNDALVTALPAVGDTLATGDTAYEIGTASVIAITGDAPFTRDLTEGVDDGADIELLESTLVALGYDADGDLEVDETFDTATAEALAAWEDDLGLEPDGVALLGQFVSVPDGGLVTELAAERGDTLSAGDTVFAIGVTTETLTASIDARDEDLIAIGDTVEINLGDDTVNGTIIAIDDPEASPADPTTETITFTIEPDQPLLGHNDTNLAVEVRITTDLAEDVTLVPAAALISTGDGDYAVEVVRSETTAFVAVEPGMFADGMVQVDGIDPGTAVVIP